MTMRLLLPILSAFVLTGSDDLSGQDVPYDVVGLLREDRIVLPAFSYQESGWQRYRLEEVGSWAAVTAYHVYDSTGIGKTTRAGTPIRVCCEDLGNYRLGHAPADTDSSRADWSPVVGYAVSDSTDQAPFVPTEARPAPELIEQLLDSLSPRPDSPAAVLDVDVWTAQLRQGPQTFFQVVRRGRDQNIGCFMITGWLLDGDPTRIDMESSGDDDCDGKGHGRRKPWALFERGGSIYMLISRLTYGSSASEIWRQISPTEWEVHLVALGHL